MNISEEGSSTGTDWLFAVGQLIMQTENDWNWEQFKMMCFQCYPRHERNRFPFCLFSPINNKVIHVQCIITKSKVAW